MSIETRDSRPPRAAFQGLCVACQGSLGPSRGCARRAPSANLARPRSARIPELEAELDQAVSAERYGEAAGIRDALAAEKDADCVALLSAHIRFYEAFNSHSAAKVGELWQRSSRVSCQHPLSAVRVGHDNVVDAFRVLFSTLPDDLRMEVSDVRIAACGPVAYVTCREMPISKMLKKRDKAQVRAHALLATTIFERDMANEEHPFLIVHRCTTPVVGGLSVY